MFELDWYNLNVEEKCDVYGFEFLVGCKFVEYGKDSFVIFSNNVWVFIMCFFYCYIIILMIIDYCLLIGLFLIILYVFLVSR